MNYQMDYFYGHEANQFTFFRIPKLLFSDERFIGLTSDAKILYGLMLDRMGLSVKNGWIDEENHVYIYFTLEEAMEYMRIGKDKGVKLFAELDDEKGCGLIKKKKQGLGKPTLIYVMNFVSNIECPEDGDFDPSNNDKAEVSESTEVKTSGNAEVKTSEKPKSGLLEMPNTALLENRSPNFVKTEVNNNDFNNNKNNNTDFSDNYPRVEHSIYDHIIYDSSTVEKPFAIALDKDPDVKMFFKIPDRFKIDTPIGTYNPDWAVLWERNGEQKLYFILETKGTESLFNLKTPEQLKIHCGKEHFKALGNGLEMYGPVKDWDKFKINV